VKALLCIEARGWRHVVEGAARYLDEGEAIVACVIDERPSQGYELAVKGLLGRRRPANRGMATVSEAMAEQVLADARAALDQSCPLLSVSTLLLRGLPNEALVESAREQEVDAIFIGRGGNGDGGEATISGTVSNWTTNHAGDAHGLLLEDGTEVRFPPHRGHEVADIISEGTEVEVRGARKRDHIHARRITNTLTGASLESHEGPHDGPRKTPLGHMARFVVDHAACDVILFSG
jgi:nucleotide-binding universal stress UspA family protein